MRIVVLDAATLGDDLSLAPLNDVGDVTVWQTTAPEETAARVREADVVVLNKIRLNESNLAGSRVRLICVAATGYDNIDTAWCRLNGITVSNVVGYSTDSVAQLTVSMVLYLANRLPEYTRAVRTGDYTRSGIANKLSPAFHEIAGKTWGIAGYGNIGRKVASVARAMGCRELRIDTNARNAAARAMYAGLGYREIAVVPTTFNGIPGVDLVLLEKHL